MPQPRNAGIETQRTMTARSQCIGGAEGERNGGLIPAEPDTDRKTLRATALGVFLFQLDGSPRGGCQ